MQNEIKFRNTVKSWHEIIKSYELYQEFVSKCSHPIFNFIGHRISLKD